MERCPYLYTGSKFRVIWPWVLIIQRGVATNPLRKICLGKTLRRTRVNHCFDALEFVRYTLCNLYCMLYVKCSSTTTQGTKTTHCIYQCICRTHFAKNSQQLFKWRRFKSIFFYGLHILSFSYRFRVFHLYNVSRFHARQKQTNKKNKQINKQTNKQTNKQPQKQTKTSKYFTTRHIAKHTNGNSKFRNAEYKSMNNHAKQIPINTCRMQHIFFKEKSKIKTYSLLVLYYIFIQNLFNKRRITIILIGYSLVTICPIRIK